METMVKKMANGVLELSETTLGEIASFEMGQAPPGADCNMEGRGTVFVKAGEFGDLYPEKKEWTTKPLKYGKDGDVFICVVGATTGKLNLGIDCAIGRSVAAIRPNAGYDARFVYYQLLPSVLRLRASSAGSAQGVLSKKQLSEIPFVVAPLPEQRRIVEAIELQLGRLDAAVARLHAAKAKLKRYRQAVLKAAVDDAIENGDMVPLEELITSIGQGWSPKCLNTPSPDEETWGVIKTTAIQPGAYVGEENKELPSPLKPRPEHELKAGDVLVTRAGPRSRVGITCLVRETRPRLMNCDKAYRLRFDAKRIEPAYVEMLLNSPQITDQLDDLKTGISDSGVNLTQGRFLILEMPVIGLKEQRAMIQKTQEATASIAEMETTLDTQLAQAVRLRQSVLKRAFEGRLV
jgi:type I restriction enzyme S subunit